ncbi:MAG: hypothetical protein ABEJ31_11335 [Haloarculaceae archaeon]
MLQTATVSKEGKTVSTTFTAKKNMARYLCTIHPSTMHGQIKLGGGGSTAAAPARAPGGGGGGGANQQGLQIPDLATLVAMLWVASVAVVAGLALTILRYFGDVDEPAE